MDAARYRARATELRAMAQVARDPLARRELLLLAEQYDWFADQENTAEKGDPDN